MPHPLRAKALLAISRREKPALGRHANRARLLDVNGRFLTTIPLAEAEKLQGSGDAQRTSRQNEHPLRIKLLSARMAQPKENVPTAGCRFPASITSSDVEAYVGITPGEIGAPPNVSRVNAARVKIAMWPFVGDDRAKRVSPKPRDL